MDDVRLSGLEVGDPVEFILQAIDPIDEDVLSRDTLTPQLLEWCDPARSSTSTGARRRMMERSIGVRDPAESKRLALKFAATLVHEPYGADRDVWLGLRYAQERGASAAEMAAATDLAVRRVEFVLRSPKPL